MPGSGYDSEKCLDMYPDSAKCLDPDPDSEKCLEPDLGSATCLGSGSGLLVSLNPKNCKEDVGGGGCKVSPPG
jgi:hypothetical protein